MADSVREFLGKGCQAHVLGHRRQTLSLAIFTLLLLCPAVWGEVQIGAAPQVQVSSGMPQSPLDRTVTVRVSNKGFREFLDEVGKQAKMEFIVIQRLDECRISAFLQDLTARKVLQMTLEVGGLTYQSAGRSNRYVIARRKGGPECPPVTARIASGSCKKTGPDPISLRCEDGSVSSLASILHEQAGANLIVWNRAVQYPISMHLKKAKLGKAVKKIKKDSALKVREMGNVDAFVIALDQENSPNNFPEGGEKSGEE